MLEVGRHQRDGAVPVLRGDVPVAAIRADDGGGRATAEVTGRSWACTRCGGEPTGRPATDPEGAVRLRARRTSMWKGTWSVGLEGTVVGVVGTSVWRGTRRYSVAGRWLADSGRTGGWSPRPTLDADPSLPLEHQGADGGTDGGGGGGGD